MNELIPTQQNENNELLVTGRDLHEFLELKTTYTQWFERMLGYGFAENVDFIVITKNVNDATAFGGTRNLIDHHIKLDMAKEISMLQRNEKGKEARQYFIEIEKKWNSPEMIVQRAMEIQKRKVQQLEQKIEAEKRYTDYGKVVEMSNASINIGAFAKLVYDKHGINLGRNRMMAWLRDNGYLMTTGRERNFPKQQFVEQGLFELKPTIVKRTHGDVQSGTPMITGKGQVRITEVLLKQFKKETGGRLDEQSHIANER